MEHIGSVKHARVENRSALARGHIRSDAAPGTSKEGQLLSLSAESLSAFSLRRTTLDGRPHLIAPVVLLTEGVHAGSGGPLFYPRDELTKNITAWNGIPVTLQHPTTPNGVPASVKTEGMLEQYGLGKLFNVRYDSGRLRGEVYVDEALAKEKAPDVVTHLESGGRMRLEVSSGLFSDTVEQPGAWRGERYVGTVRNVRPDHLALLPGGTGACSWNDGCGIRVNEKIVNHPGHGDQKSHGGKGGGADPTEAARTALNALPGKLDPYTGKLNRYGEVTNPIPHVSGPSARAVERKFEKYVGRGGQVMGGATETIEKVKISSLTSTQAIVRKGDVEFFISNPGKRTQGTEPYVFRTGGKNYLVDGNHRVAASFLLGESEISARVITPPGRGRAIRNEKGGQMELHELAEATAEMITDNKEDPDQLETIASRFAKQMGLVVMESSHTEIRRTLQREVDSWDRREGPGAPVMHYIQDVFSGHFIYQKEQLGQPMKLFQHPYTVEQGGRIEIGDGDSVEVRAKTEYVPVTNEEVVVDNEGNVLDVTTIDTPPEVVAARKARDVFQASQPK